MKGFTKVCLIVSALLICIAAVCLGAGIALGGGLNEVRAMAEAGELNVGGWHIGRWDFFWNDDWDDEEPAEIEDGIVNKQFDADGIKELDIEIRFGEVLIQDSETDQIQVIVDAPANYKYQCKKSGQALKLIDKTPSRRWRPGLSGDVNVMIAIPKGKAFKEFSFKTDAGSVHMTHRILADEAALEIDAGELIAEEVIAEKELSVDVGAGNASISRFSAGELAADCGVGELSLSGTAQNEVDAECGVGTISLTLMGRQEDFDYKIDCGLGQVRVNGDEYSSLSVDKVIDNGAGKEVSLTCGVGTISVKVEEE